MVEIKKKRSVRLPLPEDKTLVVSSSNNLINAKYGMTLWQKRVFVYCLRFLIPATDKGRQKFKLQRAYIKDIMEFYEVTNKNDYRTIREVPMQLSAVQLKANYYDEGGSLRHGRLNLLSYFSRPEDKEERNAYIELKFNDDLIEHLLDLKDRFTEYDVRNILKIRSVNSFRMFEILKSREFMTRAKPVISIEELKDQLGLEGQYERYSAFKKYILNKAKDDLERYCDIVFDFQENKQGKKSSL